MPEKFEGGRGSKSRKSGSSGSVPSQKDRIMNELKAAQKTVSEKKVASTAPRYKATHKVASGETLSHIALKYYGSAVKDKWMAIYEANKAAIGDDPGMIKVGQELNIPELD